MMARGVSEPVLWTIIFSVILVLVLVPTLLFLARLGTGGELGTATASLRSLQVAIFQLLAQPGQFAAIRNFPLFIQRNTNYLTHSSGGFILVGFSAGDLKGWSTCNDEGITRPVACPKDVACLCLYKDTAAADFDTDGDNPPKQCLTLPKNVVFLATSDFNDPDSGRGWNWGSFDDKTAPSVKILNDANGGPMQQFLPARYRYENLVLYGECDSKVWNLQNVYIEKFMSGGTAYVYIARESPATDLRHKKMTAVFGTPTA
jgi:hypothetical protein